MDMSKPALRLAIWQSEFLIVSQTRVYIDNIPRLVFQFLSCPVCGTNLVDIGPTALQEAHVRNCLEGGSGTSPQTAKYLVYKLPEESALIGTECA